MQQVFRNKPEIASEPGLVRRLTPGSDDCPLAHAKIANIVDAHDILKMTEQ
jgi:hypothetical protein